MTLLTVLMLAGKADAGTKDLYPEVKEFLNMIKTEQISNEVASEKFKSIMKDIDKEVKDDLKKHNYKDADLFLRYYLEIAKTLEDEVLIKEISKLLNDVRNEMNVVHNKQGIFENDGKILVGGRTKVNINSIQGIRGQIESAALREFRNYVLKKFNVGKLVVNGPFAVGYTDIGNGVYEYLAEIRLVNNVDFTQQIVKDLPHVNF